MLIDTADRIQHIELLHTLNKAPLIRLVRKDIPLVGSPIINMIKFAIRELNFSYRHNFGVLCFFTTSNSTIWKPCFQILSLRALGNRNKRIFPSETSFYL